MHSLFTFHLYFSLWDPKPAHKGNIYRPTPVQWCSPYRFSLYNAGFSIRAGSWQNSPAISCQPSAYYSLEITTPPPKSQNLMLSLFCSNILQDLLRNAVNALLKAQISKFFHLLASRAFGTRKVWVYFVFCLLQSFCHLLKTLLKTVQWIAFAQGLQKNQYWGYSIYRSSVYCKIFLKFKCIKSWSEDNIFIHDSKQSPNLKALYLYSPIVTFYEQNFDLFIVIFHCSQNWRGCQKILKVSLK